MPVFEDFNSWTDVRNHLIKQVNPHAAQFYSRRVSDSFTNVFSELGFDGIVQLFPNTRVAPDLAVPSKSKISFMELEEVHSMAGFTEFVFVVESVSPINKKEQRTVAFSTNGRVYIAHR